MSTQISHDIVVIGTGIAGISTVREVRKVHENTSIAIITADDGTVYSKPMLSNAFAFGKTPQSLVQKSAAEFSEDMNVTVCAHTRVLSINREDQSLIVDGPDGRAVIGYGKLVLATGATPRAYRVEGSAEAPLYSVNDLNDYTRWREALRPNARVLIIGAGLIGSEFANDLAIAGYAVSVVDPASWPLGRLLPEQIGRVMDTALGDAGVTLHMGRTVTTMARADQGGWTAQLDDGTTVNFDIALSAIGLVPNTSLAAAAGLAVDQGITVDGFMRTSDSAIFAVGDCAQTAAGVLPYILPVMNAARALAQTLTGKDTPVCLPAMPISVKIPALACVVCPPQPGVAGDWVIGGEGADLKALFIGKDGQALGFALSGSETKARQMMVKDMPNVMAA